ncbi:unnamed protein product [Sympodiomycopsis kandeliae]
MASSIFGAMRVRQVFHGRALAADDLLKMSVPFQRQVCCRGLSGVANSTRTASMNSTVKTSMLLPRRTLTPLQVAVSRSPRSFRSYSTQETTTSSTPSTPENILATYQGPMAKTFYRLKIFSFSSLIMATCFIPVFIFAPAGEELTLAGRVALCVTGLLTSGGSTALVGWISKPYVGKMYLVKDAQGKSFLECWTLSWRLKPLKTYIYQPQFVRPTSRPFASWELPTELGTSIELPSDQEKVQVSETIDVKSGKVVGSWWAESVAGTATSHGDGQFKQSVICYSEGNPVTHFQVHEEVLGDDFRIL